MTEIILKVLVSNRKACVIVLTSCMSLHTQTKKKKLMLSFVIIRTQIK